MKKLWYTLALISPFAAAADLSIDQGKILINDLIAAQQTCNKARIDDFESQKSCETAQNLESQLFAGGWCFIDSKNTYNPCGPDSARFMGLRKGEKSSQKAEPIFSYTTNQYHIGQTVPASALLYTYYPNRSCQLPLEKAKSMRYMERKVPGLGTYSGCYWRTIDNKVVSLFPFRGQTQYDTFPDFSIITLSLSPDRSEALVTGHLMTKQKMREITESN